VSLKWPIGLDIPYAFVKRGNPFDVQAANKEDNVDCSALKERRPVRGRIRHSSIDKSLRRQVFLWRPDRGFGVGVERQ